MRTQLASVATALLLATIALGGTTGTALMARTLPKITVTTPLESFDAGTSLVPSSAQNGGWLDITNQVNSGYNNYLVGVDTTHFPVTDNVTVQVEFTGDNGATVQAGCAFGTTGGAHKDRQGNPIFPSCGTDIPAMGPNGLKVRASVTIPEAGQLRLGAQLQQL